ncbi:MAG: phosphoenolpyruvate carboxylase [Alphaproteobacteria bacterium]|nr:phosphoenolpyruvate carboxylase [Alphaproteobacteria bacterium]
MGHLYALSALLARERFFDTKRDADQPVPGSIKEFLDSLNGSNGSIDAAMERLNKPVFEVTMTAHPTNTNQLKSMKAQRRLGMALRACQHHGDAHADEMMTALAAFMKEPLLKLDEKKNPVNFTVREETEMMLYFLRNIYDDLPAVYERFDHELNGYAQSKNQKYNPAALNLKLVLGSWGSAGDKDGNYNIFSGNTLQAVALHRCAAMQAYQDSLSEICSLMPGHSELQTLLHTIKEKTGELEIICNNLGRATTKTSFLEPTVFDSCMRAIAEVHPPQAFIADLTAAYDAPETPEPARRELLSLIRRARTFGFGFGKIEYRETADQYERVVGFLLPEYNALLKEEKEHPGADNYMERKREMLEELLSRPDAADIIRQHREAVQSKLDESAATPYSAENAASITYHTLKRMELAREFPDMIKDNVLAECQGAHNALEALFIQMAAAKDGRRPLLGIVPLFEDPETMQNVTGIMKGMLDSRAYQTHLQAVADFHHEGRKTQQVQIAHSDNTRRAGMMAARGFIHGAHKRLRELYQDPQYSHVALQFFEGGSISDAYRNGKRAISESVDAFNIHDFAKFTFQGGDLLNYFNQPISTARLFTRNFTHCAAGPGHKDTLPDENGKKGTYGIVKIVEPERRARLDDIIDNVAIEGLVETLKDYQRDDFPKKGDTIPNRMGALLAALDYKIKSDAGTAGSRGARGQSAIALAPPSRVQLGFLQPVQPENMRTISFSKAFQDEGLDPTIIGTIRLPEHVTQAIQNKIISLREETEITPAEKDFLKVFQQPAIQTGETYLPQAAFNILFHHSPAFRDAMDRLSHASAVTDLTSLNWYEKELRRKDYPAPQEPQKDSGDTEEITQEKNQRYADSLSAPRHRQWAMDYIKHLRNTYRVAAASGWAALNALKNGNGNGKAEAINDSGSLSFTDMVKSKDFSAEQRRIGVTTALKRINDDLITKDAYRDMLTLHGSDEDPLWGSDRLTLRLLANAGNNVMHGRSLGADDIRYGKTLAGMTMAA